MPFGEFSKIHKAILAPIIRDAEIYDIGCGDCTLGIELLKLGARSIIGIDKEPRPKQLKNDKINYRQVLLKSLDEKIDILFVSWPINDDSIDFVRVFEHSNTIIYLGSTLNGDYCGNVPMWEWLATRKLLHHNEWYKNSLIVYANQTEERPMLLEEKAGAWRDKIIEMFQKT
jgi:hypothetical protein